MLVPLNAAKVRINELRHRELTIAGSSYELPKASDKQVAAICLNLLFSKGMFRIESLTKIADRRPHLWKGVYVGRYLGSFSACGAVLGFIGLLPLILFPVSNSNILDWLAQKLVFVGKAIPLILPAK